MAKQWFVIRNGNEEGPISASDLKRLVQSGKIRSNDLVRREDMPAAGQAGRVKGLFERKAVTPIEPPPLPASSSQKRNPLTIPLICVAVVMAVPCLGVLGVAVQRASEKTRLARRDQGNGTFTALAEPTLIRADKPEAGDDDEVLTEEFLPHTVGTVHFFDELLLDPLSGAVQGKSELRQEVVSDTVISVKSKDFIAPGLEPSIRTYEIHRRASGACVQLGQADPDGKISDWIPVLMIGARKDDRWETSDGKKCWIFGFQKSGPGQVVRIVCDDKPEVNTSGEAVFTRYEITLSKGVGITWFAQRVVANGKTDPSPFLVKKFIGGKG